MRCREVKRGVAHRVASGLQIYRATLLQDPGRHKTATIGALYSPQQNVALFGSLFRWPRVLKQRTGDFHSSVLHSNLEPEE
jgi:hypothetical protein